MEPYPLSATATTWAENLGCNAWVPYKTYIWKTPISKTSVPQTPFIRFIFENPENNSVNGWKYSHMNSRYNKYGQVIEQAEPGPNNKDIFTTTVFCNEQSTVSATISHANFNECGVFTGDYGYTGGGYFDLQNGWEKGAGNSANLSQICSEISTEAKHFGQKGIKVRNAYGPTRNFKLTNNRDYLFSAWIKVAEGNFAIENHPELVMGIDYRMCSDPNGSVWPIPLYAAPYAGANPNDVRDIRTCTGKIKVKKYGDWYFLEMNIPAKNDLKNWWDKGYQFARIWVGCPSGDGNGGNATVYIDDIRFYPGDAVVNSIYYDQKWYQPILSVDENNNPGKKVEYDEFGRPFRWYKVDKGNPANETLLQQKDYYLMGPNLPPGIPSGFNVNVNYPEVSCSWVGGDPDIGQTVTYRVEMVGFSSNPNGAQKTIQTITAPASQQNISLTFTPTGLGFGGYHWTVYATDERGETVSAYAGSFGYEP